jgi:hypothetical protein
MVPCCLAFRSSTTAPLSLRKPYWLRNLPSKIACTTQETRATPMYFGHYGNQRRPLTTPPLSLWTNTHKISVRPMIKRQTQSLATCGLISTSQFSNLHFIRAPKMHRWTGSWVGQRPLAIAGAMILPYCGLASARMVYYLGHCEVDGTTCNIFSSQTCEAGIAESYHSCDSCMHDLITAYLY